MPAFKSGLRTEGYVGVRPEAGIVTVNLCSLIILPRRHGGCILKPYPRPHFAPTCSSMDPCGALLCRAASFNLFACAANAAQDVHSVQSHRLLDSQLLARA